MRGAPERRAASALIGAWGLYQVVLGLYFIFIRPSFLPEDLRAAATTLDAVQLAAPYIKVWLQWVFTVLGGQMAAVGVLLIGVAARSRYRAVCKVELVVLVVAGLFSVALMSGVNFALNSDFRWLLIAPVILWLSALAALSWRLFPKQS